MDDLATAEMLRVFDMLPDPRRGIARHKLIDILTIALIGASDTARSVENNLH